MRTISLILSITSILIITGCASTSDFSKRKYTKGRFKTHNKLKKYKAEKQLEEVSISEIVDVPKVELTENLEPKIDHLVHPVLKEKDLIVKSTQGRTVLRLDTEEPSLKKSDIKIQETETHQIERDLIDTPVQEEEQVDVEQKKRIASILASLGMLLTLLGFASFRYIGLLPFAIFISLTGLILSIIALSSPYKSKDTKKRAVIAVVFFSIVLLLWLAVIAFWFYGLIPFLPGFLL